MMKWLTILIAFILISSTAFAFTPRDDINLRGVLSILNVKNMTINELILGWGNLTGYNLDTAWIGTLGNGNLTDPWNNWNGTADTDLDMNDFDILDADYVNAENISIYNNAETENAKIWRDDNILNIDSGTGGGEIEFKIGGTTYFLVNAVALGAVSGIPLWFFNAGNTEFGGIYRDDNWFYFSSSTGGNIKFKTSDDTDGMTITDTDADILRNASVSGDFVVDSNVFFCDATTDFCAVGTNSPTNPFTVAGDVNITSGNKLLLSSNDNTEHAHIYRDNDNLYIDTIAGATDIWLSLNGTAHLGINNAFFSFFTGIPIYIFNSAGNEFASIQRDNDNLIISGGTGGNVLVNDQLNIKAQGAGFGDGILIEAPTGDETQGITFDGTGLALGNATTYFYIQPTKTIDAFGTNSLIVNGDSGRTGIITPVTTRISDTANGASWNTTGQWGALEFYSADTSGAGVHGEIGMIRTSATGGASHMQIKVKDNIVATFDTVSTALTTFYQKVNFNKKITVFGTGGDFLIRAEESSDNYFEFTNRGISHLNRATGSGVGMIFETVSAGTWGTNGGYISFEPNDIEAMKIHKNGSINMEKDLDVAGNITGNEIGGAMAFHNDTTGNVTTLDVDVWKKVTPFEQEANDAILNGLRRSNNNSLIVEVPGLYQVDFTVTFSGNANNKYHFAVGINYAEQVFGETHGRTSTASDVLSSMGGYLYNLNEGDEFMLMGMNEDGNNPVTIFSAVIEAQRKGD